MTLDGTSILFEVIVGTYEEFVLGYQYKLDDVGNIKGTLSQTFATHSHRASVRAVACGGKLLVSGGVDETINVYNMLTRKECGLLMEHNGTVTSLSFTPECSHVISTSEDGSIKVFRQGSWQLEKAWPTAHKGAGVTYLAVHPSGKMALSVGKDHTLRTWNMVKGRPAYTTNLYSRCRQLEYVVWSPGGELFAIPMETKVEISSLQSGGVVHTLQLETKVTTCIFLTDDVICTGEASGAVTCYSTRSAKQLWSMSVDQRVRGLAYLHGHLVTTTSSGVISVYAVADSSSKPRLVTSAETGCRITCLTLYDYKSEMKVKDEPSNQVEKKEEEVKPQSKAMEDSRKINKPNKKRESGDEETTQTVQKKRINAFVPESVEVKNTISVNSLKKPKLSKTTKKVICYPKDQVWTVEDSKR